MVRAVTAKRAEVVAALELSHEQSDHPLRNFGLSLVVHATDDEETEVAFVQWQSAATMDARAVSLDSLGRIITMVGFTVPVRNFRGARVVIGTLPQRMRRRKEEDREYMVGWCMLLYTCEQVRIQIFQIARSSATDLTRVPDCQIERAWLGKLARSAIFAGFLDYLMWESVD